MEKSKKTEKKNEKDITNQTEILTDKEREEIKTVKNLVTKTDVNKEKKEKIELNELAGLSPMERIKKIKKTLSKTENTEKKKDNSLSTFEILFADISRIRKDVLEIIGLNDNQYQSCIKIAHEMTDKINLIENDIRENSLRDDEIDDLFYGNPACCLNNVLINIGYVSIRLDNYRKLLRTANSTFARNFEKEFAVLMLADMSCDIEFCKTRTDSQLNIKTL